MKKLNNSPKKQTSFFEKLGPRIAVKMTEALQKLTAEPVTVAYTKFQTFEERKVFVDTGEKCFGSFVYFKSAKNKLDGIVVAAFPISGTKALIGLLLKRYLGTSGKPNADRKMKLSAFKEAVNILLLTYTGEIANSLKARLKTGVPKFACFRNVEFMKPSAFAGYSEAENTISVGQFTIHAPCNSLKNSKSGGRGLSPSIEGRFVVVY